jgi:hypothetical protein
MGSRLPRGANHLLILFFGDKYLMKTCLIALAFCLLLGVRASAQEDVKKFRYQPKKISVGTVYHYVKTNIDGTHPEQISIYVAAPDRIESFKFHPQGERAGLVIATMDWTNFSVKRLQSWQVFAGGEKKLFATLTYTNGEATVSIPATGKPDEKTAIKHLPFHVYNFDLASLNFAFRHLVNPHATFTIGIADPTFKESPLFAYKGEVQIEYVSEEQRNGALCRKYKIDGRGLENRGGFIWVNKAKEHVEDMEIALPDNPDWQTFKFLLKRIEQMAPAQWETFIKAQF